MRIGCYPYAVVRPLFDGTVGIEGTEAEFSGTGGLVSDIFEKMVREQAFDVAELGLSFYLRTLDLEDPPFVAIPVFPARQFRQSAIFVHTGSGIREPADLAGKVIGEFAMYGHDAGVAAKGVLSDEYGLRPEESRWVIGGFDWPMGPFDFVPQIHPEGVDVSRAPEGKALGPMLDAGEIDAMISADVPRCVLEGSPRVARLFPDYGAVEREYYGRTGIFPIMHTIVVRRDLAPDLVAAVYRAFCEARDVAMDHYRRRRVFTNLELNVPWFGELLDRDLELFPEGLYPYGVAANRVSIDAFLRWHFEQGLSRRRLTPEDIFVPELLGT
ncbi:4,5-dihydroxyphthalate decarboxylase [Amycolatopsis acidicola]|uniref:4,5-dihydroxyphthalate decarboxylase n=1 Tax=Amycolatopsis acidicola TaxID=2596893 RepID=A0A5N0VAA5_9PSEU|nr:4,5-dihydroxyphthalate decarboxylase [Amycolatopsis acidicola]KAA9162020.1 4,5-dihydroxyphthalate decarboxylase [Amycolatopsis acidicola]